MLLDEITRLDRWFKEYEENYSVIQKVTQLLKVLNANAQAVQNRNVEFQPFTDQKNAAIDGISKYDLGELSANQIACIQLNSADEYMGRIAADKLMDVFRDEAHDISYLASEVQKVHQALSGAASQAETITQAVKPYADVVSSTEYLTEQARFSIIFKEGVNIESLEELELRAKEWKVIMHGIGKALNVSPTEFKVLGARNGSFVIDLYLTALAIIPIGFILDRSLTILERFALSIKRIDEIFGTDIHDPAFKEIEGEIKSTVDKYFNMKKVISAKEMSEEILTEIDCEPERRHEASTFLESSIKKIFNHLRKGGDLDAFVPDEGLSNDEEGHDSDVVEAYRQIKEFRHKKMELSADLMTLLEHFDFEENATEAETDDVDAD